MKKLFRKLKRSFRIFRGESLLNEWFDLQKRKVLELQNGDEPYYGAIGGAYTTYYEIGGYNIRIQNGLTKDTFNYKNKEKYSLSNYIEEQAKSFLKTSSPTDQLEYSITFTSMGTVEKIKNLTNNTEIDLTDYESW